MTTVAVWTSFSVRPNLILSCWKLRQLYVDDLLFGGDTYALACCQRRGALRKIEGRERTISDAVHQGALFGRRRYLKFLFLQFLALLHGLAKQRKVPLQSGELDLRRCSSSGKEAGITAGALA